MQNSSDERECAKLIPPPQDAFTLRTAIAPPTSASSPLKDWRSTSDRALGALARRRVQHRHKVR
jgi:hypothetical protein